MEDAQSGDLSCVLYEMVHQVWRWSRPERLRETKVLRTRKSRARAYACVWQKHRGGQESGGEKA